MNVNIAKKDGRTKIQNKAGCRGGRKTYNCINPEVFKMKDSSGFPINNFIGFGDDSFESPLQLKTTKKFCPLKEE